MKALEFVALSDISKINSACKSQINDLNYNLSKDYYAEYYQNSFKDYSFGILSGENLLGYCICFQIEDKLSFSDSGIKIIFLDQAVLKISNCTDKIIEHIECIYKDSVCSKIIVKDNYSKGVLSSLGNALLNAGYTPQLSLDMIVDFDGFDEKLYYQNVRKSYKSLINWGKKNLKIDVINNNNLDKDKFLSFKEFHQKISGRKTRSDASWEIQYQMIANGDGELLLGNYEGELVSGSLFINQFGTTVYFTGVYERELFNFGISHYLLYLGILRASEQKNTINCYLGSFDPCLEDKKLNNIQFFKKGFCKDLFTAISWFKSF